MGRGGVRTWSRKGLVVLVLGGLGIVPSGAAERGFVEVAGQQFQVDGRPYRFVGVNLWYGANLGTTEMGRQRLVRELDLLASLGVDNLRVMGASEGATQHNTVRPAIQPQLGEFDEEVLEGLDFLLAEMAKREMYAVVFLTNYWVWSGGMSQYVAWLEDEPVPNPFLDEYDWNQFMAYSARFYGHREANARFRAYLEKLVGRVNSVTGVAYRDDPTIMSWQLANEPRPGHYQSSQEDRAAFSRWIGETAAYIKSLDSRHLVSTGNEGPAGCVGAADLFREIHRYDSVDYVTFHLWILNWGWFDPLKAEQTYPSAEEKALSYIREHVALAEELGKPLVLEEFGVPRDGHSYSPQAATSYRDRYFEAVFSAIDANGASGGPLVGSNLWAWGGYGKARELEEAVWEGGDDLTGDPPQEPQGRNSVFASDHSTLDILKRYTEKLQSPE